MNKVVAVIVSDDAGATWSDTKIAQSDVSEGTWETLRVAGEVRIFNDDGTVKQIMRRVGVID